MNDLDLNNAHLSYLLKFHKQISARILGFDVMKGYQNVRPQKKKNE